MVSKIVLTLSAMLALAAAVTPGGAGGVWGGWGANAAVNPWIPPWISAAPGGVGGARGGWGANAAVNPWIPPWISAAPGGVGGARGGWGANAAVNPWIPPWISAAPWYPKWGPCTTIGSTCMDCNTKLVCTKIGSLQRACVDPAMPHCNLGECSAIPSAECAPPALDHEGPKSNLPMV